MPRVLIPVFLAMLVLAATGSAHAADPQPQHRCDDYDPAIAWQEAPYEHFSICYTAAYADDVSWVASWVNYAHWRLAWKYGITELRTVRDATPNDPSDAYQGGADGARMHVNVMLLPRPDGNADTGITRFMHGWGSPEADALYGAIADPVRYAFIPYVTPSAPNWSTADRWGMLQAPAGHFHAKNLMHEYTHAVQHTIRVGETEQRRPWDYLPLWVTEGLAEFEGGAHTTDFYRTVGYERLIRYVVEEVPDQVMLQRTETLAETSLATITTTDVYFGGHLILYWLAETLGEDVHRRLMRYEHETFNAALMAELAAADMTMEEGWAALRAWVAAEYAAITAPSAAPVLPPPPDA
ncbi:MAG: hypothetical protein OXG19_03035 [Chloroflexi bacterium]|nr:hypothetical protein [Chloroflexota bacterium]